MAIRYNMNTGIAEVLPADSFERSLSSIATRDGHLTILQLPEYKQNATFDDLLADAQKAQEVVEIHKTTGKYHLFDEVLKQHFPSKHYNPENIVKQFRHLGYVPLSRTHIERQLPKNQKILRERNNESVMYSFIVPYKMRPNGANQDPDGIIEKRTHMFF